MKNKNNYVSLLLTMVMALALCKFALAEQNYVDILHSIGSNDSKTIAFEERVEAFYLDAPLVSSGVMRYEPPDKLIKIINKPLFISQQIDGDEVTVIKSNNEVEKFSLSRHEGLQSIANTLRSLLTGNVKYIDENYIIELVETKKTWEITLIPKNENIKKWIKKIIIEGFSKEIKRFIVIEANGDKTTTIFHDE